MTPSHTYEILLALGILSPMLSFWALVFFGPKMGKPGAGWFAVALGMGLPLVLATVVLLGWLSEDPSARAALTEHAYRLPWATLGTVPVTVGVKLDSLTVAMFFMVTVVSFLIFFFSVGYMSGHSDEVDHQSKYGRFFAYLSLFGFSMLGLVVSSSLLFLFICWELVGLCSYLLIGFYFDRPYASAAAIKAFVTNRFGDFGFLIGLMLVFFHLGTLDLDEAAANFARQSGAGTGIFAGSFTFLGWSLATIMGIGLFCGAMGKSAQFPLHVWLPDAMAGPTPVSALIHAATMVAAGVYLVARVFRLMTPEALMFVAVIGCLTLTLMALVAIVQVDIKKCLAYSTLSQLGYMIFGLGCGAWIAALFHLITHAFFKAMLFLCSGQVIEGCHHEQDMRKMGGLYKKMPVTCWTFFFGVLAISGAGIAGTKIGLGGFFSKDEILAVAYTRAFEWDDYGKHQSHVAPDSHALSVPHNGTEVRLAAHHEDNQTESDKTRREDVRQPQPVDNTNSTKPHREPPPDTKAPLGHGAIVDRPELHVGAEGEHAQSHGPAVAGHDSSHGQGAALTFARIPPLPKWMFWFALFTAYVTPFYMMRAWWMTFMGKPRNEEVYHHAHEMWLMYVPLIALAVGTFFASYFLFRPLISDAALHATAAPAVLATDGHVHTAAMNAAHRFLLFGVGGAFIVGFAIAIAIYRSGLATADRIKRAAGLLYVILERKYFFDEVYNLVWVQGCLLLSKIIRWIDTYVVDLLFDLAAFTTERLSAFSGWVLDNHGVDGVVNGVAKTSMDIAEVMRTPQTGRIRNYVLFAAAVATAVIFCVLLWGAGSEVAAATVPTIR